MQSDQFDKKVREAADHHHPPYDEKAWEKMEKLLDKHLPQKKDDRRRYIFFILLFLLTAGGLYLIIDKPWQSNKPFVSDQKNSQNASVHSPKLSNNNNIKKTNPVNSNDLNLDKSPIAGEMIKSGPNKQRDVVVAKTNRVPTSKQPRFTNNPLLMRENSGSRVIGNEQFKKNNTTGVKSDIIGKEVNVDNNNVVKAVDEKTQLNNDATVDQKLNTNINKDTSENITNSLDPIAKKPKANIKKGNSFFLSVSAGPDMSSVGLENFGKTKLLAGVSIGYSFKNKFTLRTGFYTARKIYSARAYQYHSGYQWVGNYKLESVDADCKVYEIPILLSYHFSHSTKQSWFATTGISSYLMKREDYDYQYKNSLGQTYTHKWTLKDKNKHYFSVLTLSGGYQRNINNTFSIAAEPYMKIPLSGVGNGKVKLNSAGVLVSVGIKLFGPNKNN